MPANPSMKGLHLRQPRAGQLGRHLEGVLPAHDQHHRDAPRRGSTPTARRSRSGRRWWRRCPKRSAGRSSPSSRRCSAACSSATTPKVMHYADGPAILEFVGSARGADARRQGHHLPGSLPAHEDRAAVGAVHARPGDARRSSPRSWARWSSATRPTTRPTTSAASGRTRRRCATRCPCCCWCPASACSPSRRTSRRRASPPSTTSTRSTSMRWAEGVDEYVPIPEQEAFDIEYWLLEEAKLQRLPKAEGARGPGRARHRRRRRHRPAVARRLLAEGAHVVLSDRDQAALDDRVPSWARRGARQVRGVVCDVTRRSVGGGVEACAVASSSAASTSSSRTPASPRRRRSRTTTLADVADATCDILATGYFLVAREAFALMKRQGIGGSIVFVGSKNALVASRRRLRLLRGQGRGAAPRALPGRRGRARSASAPTS